MGQFRQRINQKVSNLVQRIKIRVEFLREKLADYFGLYQQPISTYKCTAEEEEILNKTAGLMRQYFNFENGTPGQELLHESHFDRCMAFEDYAREVAAVAGIDDIEIRIEPIEDVSEDGRIITTCGQINRDAGVYFINADMLATDDPELLERMIMNIPHEIRHLMQQKAACLENTYGTSFETRHRFRNGYRNYIRADEDFEAYFNQYIEADARCFAAAAWQRACRKAVCA